MEITRERTTPGNAPVGACFTISLVLSQIKVLKFSVKVTAHFNRKVSTGEKKSDLTQSSDKSLYIHGKLQKAKTTQKCHQNFDYTTNADRGRTVSCINDRHPTGVVKPVYGIRTFPLTVKAV